MTKFKVRLTLTGSTKHYTLHDLWPNLIRSFSFPKRLLTFHKLLLQKFRRSKVLPQLRALFKFAHTSKSNLKCCLFVNGQRADGGERVNNENLRNHAAC